MELEENRPPALRKRIPVCGGRILSFGHKLTLPGGFEAEGLCDECQLLLALVIGRRSRQSSNS